MHSIRPLVTACAAFLWGVGCVGAPEAFQYPATRMVDVVDDYHGTSVADPYRWLESLDSEETQSWIAAQNALAEPCLQELPARAYFTERLRTLDESGPPPVPERQGAYWVTRTHDADGKSVFLVHDTVDGPPRARVDLSKLAPDADDVLRSVRLSPDGRFIAYSVAPGNGELTEIRVRELATGRDLDERIPDVALDAFQWMARSDGIVYGRYLQPGSEIDDAVNREAIVGVHVLGTSPSQDHVLYRADPADDPAVAMVEISSDGRFLLLAAFYS